MLDVIAWGITHRVVYRDHMLVHFGTVRSPDHLVQVADLLLLTYGISWVVCAGVVEKPRRLVAIFRGDGHHQDVGHRAAQAFGGLGSAGGHRTMGRAEVPLTEDQTLDDTCGMLVRCLFKRMRPARARSFIRTLRKHLGDLRPADPDEYELDT
jgi:nanoRNase/pAp phosphatase (c-di-AMP/oligoRNAs hydrolase)